MRPSWMEANKLSQSIEIERYKLFGLATKAENEIGFSASVAAIGDDNQSQSSRAARKLDLKRNALFSRQLVPTQA